MIIKRIQQNDSCTIGWFMDGDVRFAFTLEPPDKNNETNKSCIPAATYPCERGPVPIHLIWMTARYGYQDIFEIKDVPGRSGIYIHIGDFPNQTLGCVLTGGGVGENRLFDSAVAYDAFYKKMAGINSFSLTIEGG